jgi:hypothetical protein
MLKIMHITERKFYNGFTILALKAENLLHVISNTSITSTLQRALVENSVDTWTNSG